MIRVVSEPQTPLLVSVPHAGTQVPAECQGEEAPWRCLPDTDWHVDRLVDELAGPGAGIQVAELSRYVIDLNRPPDNAPLYSGAGTGLVPLECFDGTPLYQPQSLPDQIEVQRRLEEYWLPYHQRLASTLEGLRDRHGHAVLLDAHSIASRVPRLFEGRLPDLNLGFNQGKSCSPSLQSAITELLSDQKRFSWVVDGRFKGGYITRHYGQPAQGLHALQLEISQACYLDEDQPQQFDEQRAADLRELVLALGRCLMDWRP